MTFQNNVHPKALLFASLYRRSLLIKPIGFQTLDLFKKKTCFKSFRCSFDHKSQFPLPKSY